MPERSARLRLDDIERQIGLIEAALNGVDRDTFEADPILQADIVRFIEVIGEAANRLPPPLRAAAPEIPWPAVVSMRNLIAHGYYDIDIGIIWETATVAILELKPVIGRFIALCEQGGSNPA